MSPANLNHLTSLSACEKGSNVFIWSPRRDFRRIAFNWRIDDDQPMTHETMYRWLDLVITERQRTFVSNLNYLVFPVEISRDMSRPLAYFIKHTDPQSLPLPRNSKDLLVQGDYGIYLPDGSISRLPYHYHCDANLLNQYKSMTRYLKRTIVYEDPPEAEVRERDGDICSMTGALLSKNELEVTWILPPYMFQMMPIHQDERVRVGKKFDEDLEAQVNFMKPMFTPHNCLQMSDDLVEHFIGSRIAIDVDDDYRIFRFFGRDMLEKGCRNPLKTHLTFKERPNDAVNEFLRAHFLYSLLVQVIRGDIADHYNEDAVEIFMGGNEVIPGNYDLERPRWKRGIGLQVLAWLNGAEPLSWEEILEKADEI